MVSPIGTESWTNSVTVCLLWDGNDWEADAKNTVLSNGATYASVLHMYAYKNRPKYITHGIYLTCGIYVCVCVYLHLHMYILLKSKSASVANL